MFLLVDEKGRTYLVKGTEDLHTNYGVVKAKDLKKTGAVVESHMGHRFRVLKPNITDFMSKAKRGPQAVTPKDCALISGFTGIKSGSRVVEAGTGSGILSMFLANVIAPRKLITHEIRDDFAKIARENFKKFGITNVQIKRKDIYQGISEKNLDLIVLDLPEPWLVVAHAKKSLKVGGYIVSYSPSIEQSKKFHDALNGFRTETFETLKREWKMETVRPHTRMLGHTGFLTVARWLG